MAVISVLLLTAAVAGSVVLVVHAALKARRMNDQDAPLDEHLDAARGTLADARETITKFLFRGGKHRRVSARWFLFTRTGSSAS